MKRGVLVLLVCCAFALQGDLMPAPSSSLEALESDTIIVSVDSTNLRFSPSSVTITEGDTVRFFWSGQALPHNAVEENGVFDTGEPARAVDESFTFPIGSNGTYVFVCEPHESVGMVGEIIVEPAEATPEPPATSQTPSEDTPFLSMMLTATVLGLAVAVRRLQGNG